MRLTLLAGLGALALAGCGSEPDPTGHPQITEEDREMGAEQHPQLLAEFGGDYTGRQAEYVRVLGNKIASAAGLPGQCTFTLVNSDVVNAFAVPGCYIYVTRGLLAIVGSEAELASVLAHEIGHIVGAHSQRQQSRSLWRTLGVLAVSLTGSEQLTRIAGQAAQFFSLRYSRTQEYEADTLGIRYLRDAHYDPYAAADMLTALDRQETFMAETGGHDEARAIPEWARSHPLTDRRIERALEIARSTGLADDALAENEAGYLKQIDGLLFGDDPEQGFVSGRRFVHPIMRIAFAAPEGFTLTNSPQAIAINGRGDVRGEFGGGQLPPGGLTAYIDQLATQIVGRKANVGDAESLQVNGLPALMSSVQLDTDRGAATLHFAAYDAGNGDAYHFIMIAGPEGASAQNISDLFRSFRRVSPEEAAQLKPRHIRIATVPNGQTSAQLWKRMASEHPHALFLMLNGLDANAPVPANATVKIVDYQQ